MLSRLLPTWNILGEQLVDDTRRARMSIASVQLPDGVRFEQWVMRLPAQRYINEAVEVKWIPLADIPQLISDGQIVDSASIIGLQQVLLGERPATIGRDP